MGKCWRSSRTLALFRKYVSLITFTLINWYMYFRDFKYKAFVVYKKLNACISRPERPLKIFRVNTKKPPSEDLGRFALRSFPGWFYAYDINPNKNEKHRKYFDNIQFICAYKNSIGYPQNRLHINEDTKCRC